MRTIFCVFLGALTVPPADEVPGIYLHTFSIVARDPRNGDFAVGVATFPQGVRRLCPFARAGVGAVATQAFVNVSLGNKGLDLMAQGLTPQQAVEKCIREDRGGEERQLGMIDSKNPPFAFTGKRCIQHASSLQGKDYSVQGNMLKGRATIEEIAKTFEQSPGSLAGRVIRALAAGQAAGGDYRGHRSCAVIVASKRRPDGLLIDLSEDNDKEPIESVRRKFFETCRDWFQLGDRDLKKGDAGGDVTELRQALKLAKLFEGDAAGPFDDSVERALQAFQKLKKLPATGMVDLPTARALIEELDGQ